MTSSSTLAQSASAVIEGIDGSRSMLILDVRASQFKRTGAAYSIEANRTVICDGVKA